MHEAKLHSRNCFITLTYDDSHLPANGSLHYPDFVRFMKRFRKAIAPTKIRFYMCGEYGERFGRPHFHACIFGFDFDDKSLIRAGKVPLWRSPRLEKLWKSGYSSVGEVTFESAAYVARYIMSKVTGPLADFKIPLDNGVHLSHYEYLDADTGEIVTRVSEFNQMSRGSGIGSGWFQRFRSDIYPHDYCVVRGKKSRPPRYYDRLLDAADPDMMEAIRLIREQEGLLRKADNTPARLADREICASARAGRFSRKLK